MKAIIVAAGKGSRLLPHTENMPKCLLKVRGHSILDYQLNALYACGIKDIVIVTGYLEEKIRQHITVPVTFITNSEYRDTNSAYSLLLAKDHLRDGFIHINSDLLFHPEMLKALIDHKEESGMIIERIVQTGSDMKKIVLQGNNIVRMDKKLPENEADAEAVGPVKFGKEGSKKIISMLESLTEEEKAREWAYGLFSKFASTNSFVGVDNPGYFWAEIDTASDLIEANQNIPPDFMLDMPIKEHAELSPEAGEPLDDLDKFLNTHLKELVRHVPDVSSRVSKELKKKREDFNNHISNLGTNYDTASSLYKDLKKRLIEGEEYLEKEFSPYSPFSPDGLRAINTRLLSMCPDDRKTVIRLKRDAALSFLTESPPKNLLEIQGAETIEEAAQKEDVLTLLSLTRMTEDDQWQKIYRKYIESLTIDSFEKDEVDVVVINESKIANKMAQRLKPWKMTHAKEVGKIICICPSNPSLFETPWLLYVLVFFRYFFETTCHSNYYSLVAGRGDDLGKEIMRTIHNQDNKLSFFYSNLYSENLFWGKAMALFYKSFDAPSLSYFKDTASLGGLLSEKNERSMVSLNLIDQIWNVNLLGIESIADIFIYDTMHFLYHFRGAMLAELIGKITNKQGGEVEKLIINNLGMDDVSFTAKIIS